MSTVTPASIPTTRSTTALSLRRFGRPLLFIVAVACLTPFVVMYRQYTINAYYEQRIPIRMVDYRAPLPCMSIIGKLLDQVGFDQTLQALQESGTPYYLNVEGSEVDRQTSQMIVAWSREWEALFVRRGDARWTDENTNDLRSLKKLKMLGLDDIDVSGKSMDAISQMTQLEALNLRGTAIRDEDLRFLRALTQLKKLGISRTQITGNRLEDVASLPNLEFLTVARCEHFVIDPTVFEPFRGHPNLKKLCIDTRFSERDVADIKKILPNVEMWVVSVIEPQEIYPSSAPEGTNSPGF